MPSGKLVSCDPGIAVLIAGNTLKQHLQSIMPPRLNLSITATGMCYCFTAAAAAHQQSNFVCFTHSCHFMTRACS